MPAFKDIWSFDIYAIVNGFMPRLVERTEGLAEAKQRMAELAAQVPGRYYIWNSYSRETLQTIDTTLTKTPSHDSHQ
jgi:hypothetical protein